MLKPVMASAIAPTAPPIIAGLIQTGRRIIILLLFDKVWLVTLKSP
jgi:hypothetical protein